MKTITSIYPVKIRINKRIGATALNIRYNSFDFPRFIPSLIPLISMIGIRPGRISRLNGMLIRFAARYGDKYRR